MGETTGKSSDNASAPAELLPYDFRRPILAQAGPSREVDVISAAFESKLAASLSEHLRVAVKIDRLLTEPMRYDEFLFSLQPTTCLSVMRVEPGSAEILFDVPLELIYPMIDRLLGGTSDAAAPLPQRALTGIEQSLALQIVERAAEQLADTFSDMTPTTVREQFLQSDPSQLRIMPAEEMVTVLRFHASIPGASGMLSLCLPAPVVALLNRRPSTDPQNLDQRELEKHGLTRNILEAAVELRALLAETKIRLSDVLTMQPGDVITTDHPSDLEISVQVEGKDKLRGQLGHFRGTRAVQITRPAEADSPHPSARAEARQ